MWPRRAGFEPRVERHLLIDLLSVSWKLRRIVHAIQPLWSRVGANIFWFKRDFASSGFLERLDILLKRSCAHSLTWVLQLHHPGSAQSSDILLPEIGEFEQRLRTHAYRTTGIHWTSHSIYHNLLRALLSRPDLTALTDLTVGRVSVSNPEVVILDSLASDRLKHVALNDITIQVAFLYDLVQSCNPAIRLERCTVGNTSQPLPGPLSPQSLQLIDVPSSSVVFLLHRLQPHTLTIATRSVDSLPAFLANYNDADTVLEFLMSQTVVTIIQHRPATRSRWTFTHVGPSYAAFLPAGIVETTGWHLSRVDVLRLPFRAVDTYFASSTGRWSSPRELILFGTCEELLQPLEDCEFLQNVPWRVVQSVRVAFCCDDDQDHQPDMLQKLTDLINVPCTTERLGLACRGEASRDGFFELTDVGMTAISWPCI